jgi:hypothetical protein
MAVCALVFAAVLVVQTRPPAAYELLSGAKWDVLFERWDAAIRAAQELEAKYPDSPLARDARCVRHRAELFKLLERTTGERSATPWIRELESLSRQPADEAVAAAKLALATLYYLATSKRKPEALLAEALRDWQALDHVRATPGRRPHHEYDVVEIRNLVFQPHGDGIFAGDQRWSDFTWAPRAAKYLLVSPAIPVFLGETERVRVVAYDPFPGHPNVLFIGDERRVLLDRIISRLGTAKRRPWMKPGKPLDVLAWWSKASLGMRGNMGGWVFETQPRISSISFLDPQRTRAVVTVVIGSASGAVWLEKRDGRWVAGRLRHFRTW